MELRDLASKVESTLVGFWLLWGFVHTVRSTSTVAGGGGWGYK